WSAQGAQRRRGKRGNHSKRSPGRAEAALSTSPQVIPHIAPLYAGYGLADAKRNNARVTHSIDFCFLRRAISRSLAQTAWQGCSSVVEREPEAAGIPRMDWALWLGLAGAAIITALAAWIAVRRPRS